MSHWAECSAAVEQRRLSRLPFQGEVGQFSTCGFWWCTGVLSSSSDPSCCAPASSESMWKAGQNLISKSHRTFVKPFLSASGWTTAEEFPVGCWVVGSQSWQKNRVYSSRSTFFWTEKIILTWLWLEQNSEELVKCLQLDRSLIPKERCVLLF